MKKRLKLTDETWSYGSYPRGTYKQDMLYTFFQYKDFQVIYNMGRFDIRDELVEQAVRDGLATEEQRAEYLRRISRLIDHLERYDQWPVERLYGEIYQMRRQIISARGLEEEKERQLNRGCAFDPSEGIDQRKKKRQLFMRCRALLFALCEPDKFFMMKEDVEEALRRGIRVYVLVNDSEGNGLPSKELLRKYLCGEQDGGTETPIRLLADEDVSLGLNLGGIAWDGELQEAVDSGEAALLVYGEEGFLHCRRLLVDAVVCGRPSGYFTKALLNQLDGGRDSVVYVPKHFDITDWVRLTEKTVISYWQLARLWEAYGDGIYEKSVEELYRAYPQYFLNIYENGADCPEAGESYPIRIEWPEEDAGTNEGVIGRFYRLRSAGIEAFLNSQKDLTYISTYFNEEMEQTEIPWYSRRQQRGILVQGIRTSRAGKSRVIRCDGSLSLRQQVKADSDSLLLLSNFLFFVTPKLAGLYNKLRDGRPLEQVDVDQEHLDYMLYRKDGRRIETFPLYQKACIAMKEDGGFLFFRYRLGGGRMTVSGYSLRWSEADVDVRGEDASAYANERQEAGGFGCATASPVRVYTPYYSQPDQDHDAGDYRVLVGEGRMNIIVIQDRIVCIRDGEVMLPSLGVVVSLDRRTGEEFRQAVGRAGLGRGYYDCTGLTLQVELDGPAQVPQEQWRQVRWAFGGGMSLILGGRDVFEEQAGGRCLIEEGWMSPLSRQTQESAVHEMTKHPRTAVGITKNGDLFILVFSGRTLLSAGADYREMCRIAEELFPDVWCMMNVDGGGSSVLGTVIGGSFMELSYPATSIGSCAGMVRQIHTALCLEQ